MKSVKFSRQRECIKNYLMSRKDHPTADMVYEAVRQEYPNISLGTVYRNLNFLVEYGDIIKIRCDESCDRFDANTSKHYHFICRNCGRVIDLEMIPVDHIDVLAGEHFSGVIEGHQAFFYGLCEVCKNSQTEKS